MIVLHNPLPHEKNKIIDTIDFERDREILCCVPCNHDRYAVVAIVCNNNISVEVINLESKERIITFEETDIVLDIVVVPGKYHFCIFFCLSMNFSSYCIFLRRSVFRTKCPFWNWEQSSIRIT